MSANRLFYVLGAFAIVAILTLTSWEAFSAKSAVTADRNHDQVQQVRLGTSAGLNGTGPSMRGHRGGFTRYPPIREQLVSAGVTNQPVTDRAYDVIENLRVTRGAK